MDCMDAAAREALELTGFTCPQTQRAQRAAAAAAAAQHNTASSRRYTPSDPSREQPGFVEVAMPAEVAPPPALPTQSVAPDPVLVKPVAARDKDDNVAASADVAVDRAKALP